jgi:hypothetical protein
MTDVNIDALRAEADDGNTLPNSSTEMNASGKCGSVVRRQR